MGQMRKEDKLQTEDIREWLVSTLDATQWKIWSVSV
jgi:hypothetical protein